MLTRTLEEKEIEAVLADPSRLSEIKNYLAKANFEQRLAYTGNLSQLIIKWAAETTIEKAQLKKKVTLILSILTEPLSPGEGSSNLLTLISIGSNDSNQKIVSALIESLLLLLDLGIEPDQLLEQLETRIYQRRTIFMYLCSQDQSTTTLPLACINLLFKLLEKTDGNKIARILGCIESGQKVNLIRLLAYHANIQESLLRLLILLSKKIDPLTLAILLAYPLNTQVASLRNKQLIQAFPTGSALTQQSMDLFLSALEEINHTIRPKNFPLLTLTNFTHKKSVKDFFCRCAVDMVQKIKDQASWKMARDYLKSGLNINSVLGSTIWTNRTKSKEETRTRSLFKKLLIAVKETRITILLDDKRLNQPLEELILIYHRLAKKDQRSADIIPKIKHLGLIVNASDTDALKSAVISAIHAANTVITKHSQYADRLTRFLVLLSGTEPIAKKQDISSIKLNEADVKTVQIAFKTYLAQQQSCLFLEDMEYEKELISYILESKDSSLFFQPPPSSSVRQSGFWKTLGTLSRSSGQKKEEFTELPLVTLASR